MTITTTVITDSMKSSKDHEDEVMLAPSTGETMNDMICKPTKRGQCEVHGIKMKKLSVSSKKWCDRGGGRGYGWKTQKVPKYICTAKNTVNKEPDISDEGRFSDYQSSENSVLGLSRVGADADTLRGGSELSNNYPGEMKGK